MSVDIDPETAMLARLAELDLAAVEEAHARFMAAEPGAPSDNAGRTYQRMARSLRQTIALKARVRREAAVAKSEPASEPESDARPRRAPDPVLDAAAEAKADEIRIALKRLIYSEREDEAPDYMDDVDIYVEDESGMADFLAEAPETIMARLWTELELGALPSPLRYAPPTPTGEDALVFRPGPPPGWPAVEQAKDRHPPAARPSWRSSG